jgi:ketosteroid isomerase-like protein
MVTERCGSEEGHEVAIAGRSSMGSADEAVVLAFNAAINRRDLPGLGRLMADDHRFIDTAGDTVAGKRACLEAWRGFFESFPDYRNVFDDLRSRSGGVVEVHGRSECSVAALAGPARWSAVVADGLVVEWRVFDATGLDC